MYLASIPMPLEIVFFYSTCIHLVVLFYKKFQLRHSRFLITQIKAERIEDKATCDLFRGHYFSKPLPVFKFNN